MLKSSFKSTLTITNLIITLSTAALISSAEAMSKKVDSTKHTPSAKYELSKQDTNAAAVKNTKAEEEYPGYVVKYDYKGHPKERELAYQFYLENQYMAGITKDQLGIDLYDLDDDGEKEIILYINGGDECPRAGCPFTTLKILDLDNKKYKVINWTVETGLSLGSDDIPPKILNTKSNGYHDFLWKPDNIYKWNGEYYTFSINN